MPNLSNCNYWNNRNGTTLKWELGAGTLSNWLGGPTKDASIAEDAEKGKIDLEKTAAWVRISPGADNLSSLF